MSDAHTVTARSFAQTYCSDWSAVRFLLESVPSKDCYPDATRLQSGYVYGEFNQMVGE